MPHLVLNKAKTLLSCCD